ncbi:hypothetical protein BDW42DRAFT_99363 [Aspergillus taichungensis]|uniref:Uncharacterized protein n=1 Tax=Aspergillus taichungensis TaxID=482145 RepID=A0A2J5HVT5_9EURO|nr:hypothetical protein BDW42DRAFT_99363 [Aspergillus taichungensis]
MRRERDVSSLCFLFLSFSLLFPSIAFSQWRFDKRWNHGAQLYILFVFSCSLTPCYLFVFPSLIFLSIYQVSTCTYC